MITSGPSPPCALVAMDSPLLYDFQDQSDVNLLKQQQQNSQIVRRSSAGQQQQQQQQQRGSHVTSTSDSMNTITPDRPDGRRRRPSPLSGGGGGGNPLAFFGAIPKASAAAAATPTEGNGEPRSAVCYPTSSSLLTPIVTVSNSSEAAKLSQLLQGTNHPNSASSATWSAVRLPTSYEDPEECLEEASLFAIILVVSLAKIPTQNSCLQRD